MAAREGWEVVGEFQDEGFSAYTGNRGPGLEEAQRLAAETAAAHGECVLVAQHSDRIARGDGTTSQHFGEVFFWARRNRVRIWTTQTGREVEDPMRATMEGERDHEDSKRKSEAVKAGKRRAFERGDWQGGPVPDGYVTTHRVDERGTKIVDLHADPEREPVLRLLFDLADEGRGDPSIARTLNRAGHRTQAGNAWTRRQVQNVLTNWHYAGLVVWRRGTPEQEVRQGRHPALIEPERFERFAVARAGRDQAATGRPKGGRPTTRYALAKLGVCDACGSRMYATTSPYKRKKDGAHQRTYTCAHVQNQTGLCDAPKIDADVIDRAVVEHLDKLFVDFEAWVARLAEGANQQRKQLEGRLNAKMAELTKHERREAKLRERYLDSVDADTGLRAAQEAYDHVIQERDSLRNQCRALQEQLAAEPKQPPADALLDVYNGLAASVRGDGSVAEVNERLRASFREFRMKWVEPGVVGILPVLQSEVVARYTDVTPTAFGPDGETAMDLPTGSPIALFAEPPVKPVEIDFASEYAAYEAEQGALPKTGQGSQEYLFMKWKRPALAASQP